MDPTGKILRTNAAARRMLELSETGYQESTASYIVYRRDGSRLTTDELPSSQALARAGSDPTNLILRCRNQKEQVVHVSAHRLYEGFGGTSLTALVVYRDVTEERQRTD